VHFEHGEVLVTRMTTPSYVVAMRKAKAIITDEGGITSHAAIVTRELGIPCIVGTHFATKILQNGDWVQVNANNGTITKLETPTLPSGESVKPQQRMEEFHAAEVSRHSPKRTGRLTISLRAITSKDREIVGGKAASVAKLAKRFLVPEGFCISTLAFQECI